MNTDSLIYLVTAMGYFGLILYIVCFSTCFVVGTKSKELRLLGMLPMTGDIWNGGISCRPATLMAIEDVNANTTILRDYNLSYSWIDTKCNPGVTLYRMFEALNNNPPYVMLLGAGCSVVSEATAQSTHFWNLTQFSYASSSPVLSDRKTFPRFFRLALSEQKLNPARIDLMKHFKWKKVSTLHEATKFSSAVINDFVKQIQDLGMSIISQEIFINDPYTMVENLKARDARIIMTHMYEGKAREVLCAAYKVGLYGPKIVWVFPGWFSKTFWKVKIKDLNCTEDEMDMVAEGMFLTGPVYSNPVEKRGIAGMNVSEFKDRFSSYRANDNTSKEYDFYAPQCYDHIWVAAKALECADAKLKEIGSTKTLDTFHYQDTEISQIIFDCVSQTSLTGVSGDIVFSEGADPVKIVKLERIQDGVRETVALYRQDKDPKEFEWKENALRWKDNVIPRDSTLVTNIEVKIPLYMYFTITGLAGLGIIITISFFIFNVVKRNDRFVRLSSPYINNVFLVGCLFCYSTVFMKTIEIENKAICKIRIFCFSIGFTLTFGALFAKTWRVYRIFTNKNLQKINIKDYQLFAIVGVLVAIVLVIIISWEVISPHTVRTRFLPKKIEGNDAEIVPFVRVCESDMAGIFSWVIYISQGALLSFGAFLAWETKKVQIKALNDSHQIGVCVYNVLILSAMGLTFSLLLKDQEVLMYGITSGCLILGTAMTQLIIFIPKIRAMSSKDINRNLSIRTMARGNSTISQINLPNLMQLNKE